MTKMITTAELRTIGGLLFSNWEKNKDEIKLSGKNLYALLSLKKALEIHLTTVEETLASLAKQFGGTPRKDGAIVIPEEQREEANIAFMEFSKETLTIEYRQISIEDSDYLPIDIFEAIFDFISFKE